MNIRQVRDAFSKLDSVFYNETRNRAQELLKMCKTEEKQHRGFMNGFGKAHTPDTIGAHDAAKLFAVKRVAEYLLCPANMPKGQEYLHIQRSCFLAAGMADEFRAKILRQWDGISVEELAGLDYCEFVKVRKEQNARPSTA